MNILIILSVGLLVSNASCGSRNRFFSSEEDDSSYSSASSASSDYDDSYDNGGHWHWGGGGGRGGRGGANGSDGSDIDDSGSPDSALNEDDDDDVDDTNAWWNAPSNSAKWPYKEAREGDVPEQILKDAMVANAGDDKIILHLGLPKNYKVTTLPKDASKARGKITLNVVSPVLKKKTEKHVFEVKYPIKSKMNFATMEMGGVNYTVITIQKSSTKTSRRGTFVSWNNNSKTIEMDVYLDLTLKGPRVGQMNHLLADTANKLTEIDFLLFPKRNDQSDAVDPNFRLFIANPMGVRRSSMMNSNWNGGPTVSSLTLGFNNDFKAIKPKPKKPLNWNDDW